MKQILVIKSLKYWVIFEIGVSKFNFRALCAFTVEFKFSMTTYRKTCIIV